MNAFTRILTIGAISSLSLGTALAQDPSNTSQKFGLGYGSTLAGVNGVSARYGLGGGLALEGVVGYWDSTNTQTDKKTNGTTSNEMGIGVAFDYKVRRGERTKASITGEFNYAQTSIGTISDGEEKGQKYSDIAIGTGMRVEWWPASYFSVNTRFGLVVSPNGSGDQAGASYGGTDDKASDTDYGGMDYGLSGSLLGGAGVTFWFR